MAGLFGKTKELEQQLAAMQTTMIQGLTNIHIYGQLIMEDAESSAMKEQVQVLIRECERLLDVVSKKE